VLPPPPVAQPPSSASVQRALTHSQTQEEFPLQQQPTVKLHFPAIPNDAADIAQKCD
jgi:hypothetical protein